MRNRLVGGPAVAELLVLALAGGCGGGSVPARYASAIQTSHAPAFKPGHLYVGQTTFYAPSKIYRYPLSAEGLPSRTPDGELTVHAHNPGSIAIGPNGDLYVSVPRTPGTCNGKCFVEVFAPLASHHAKPIRVLYVPQDPLYVAVDHQQGYLDVSTLQGHSNVNVYAPNARGHDKPVNQITQGVNALAARDGIVYIQTLRLGLGIEAVPEVGSSPPPVYYRYGYNFSGDGVATGSTYLYAQFFWPQGYKYLLATAVYRIGQPGYQIRTVIGTSCQVSRNGGALGYGLATYKKYIYEGCIDKGGLVGSVLVYDSTKNGKQKAIEVLPGGNLGVAIGP
jgi:hypothetical protein